MKLYLDTSSREKSIIKLDNNVFETESRNANSQTLLPFIEQNLTELGLTMHDITEIEIATGPGSFTGLRVGLSIAQTLAWFLHIPVNGKRIDNGEQVTLSYS